MPSGVRLPIRLLVNLSSGIAKLPTSLYQGYS